MKKEGTTTGRIAINNGQRDKYILPEEVNIYLQEG